MKNNRKQKERELVDQKYLVDFGVILSFKLKCPRLSNILPTQTTLKFSSKEVCKENFYD